MTLFPWLATFVSSLYYSLSFMIYIRIISILFPFFIIYIRIISILFPFLDYLHSYHLFDSFSVISYICIISILFPFLYDLHSYHLYIIPFPWLATFVSSLCYSLSLIIYIRIIYILFPSLISYIRIISMLFPFLDYLHSYHLFDSLSVISYIRIISRLFPFLG
jgi:hypothetical protein